MREFTAASASADIAVIYFAGHGFEIGGKNYLIPVDAKLQADIDVQDEALALDRLFEATEHARRLRLIILDACRDNPFLKSIKRTIVSRQISNGLTGVEPSSSDTLVAFAAKAGSTADDGRGKDSPFTSAVLNNLFEPGVDIRIALGRLRDEVKRNTRNRQEPFTYGSLGGSTVALVPKAEPKPVAASPAQADIRRDFELAAQIGTRDAWTSFLTVYKTGFYAELARAALAKLGSAGATDASIQDRREPADKEQDRQAEIERVRQERWKRTGNGRLRPNVPKRKRSV